jgi:opacity protein-like surface antigen
MDLRVFKIGILVCCITAAPFSVAQSGNATRKYKWEIEIHGSGFLKDDANGGVKSTPPAGASFATIAPNVNSRAVSSFLFGDGNALINQVLVGQGLNPIPSLDGAILNNRFALERQSNIGGGIRLSRYVGRRIWLDWTNEYDFDYDDGSFEINEKEDADGFHSMQAWATSLESLLATCGKPCPFAVAALQTSTHEKGHQFSSALTANYDLPTNGRFVPYVGAGAGLVVSFAGTPRQEYFGHYSSVDGSIQGSDHVKVNFQVPPVVPALIVASGAKYQISDRWGLRMEMRNNFESHSFTTVVQAQPEFSEGGAGNAIVLSGGGAAVQFSDNQSLAPSSLSKPLAQFRTFKSTGLRYEGRISGGVYYRF